VIIKADNADGTLLPGMTANVEFIKETRENALLVQNSALRYQPSSLGAQEIQRMVYAAGLADLSEDAKKAALAEYDAALKATDLAKNASSTTTSGLSSILAGGGQGGPGGPGGFGNKKTAAAGTESASDLAASATADSTVAKKALWYLDSQGKLAVRMVGVGSTDGARTEIIGADDLEGMKIILREKAE